MFVAKENRIEIDLHGKDVVQAKFELDEILDFLPIGIYEVVVIHGYKYGERILKYVREEYRHKNVVNIRLDRNPGITIYEVERIKIKDIGR